MRSVLALVCAAALPALAQGALRGGVALDTPSDALAGAVPPLAGMEETPRFAAAGHDAAAAGGGGAAPKWLEKPPYWLPTPPEWGPPPAHIFTSFYAPNTIPQPVFRPSPLSYDSTNFRASPPWTSPAITASALPGGVVGIPATSRYTGYMNVPSPGALGVGSGMMAYQQQQMMSGPAAYRFARATAPIAPGAPIGHGVFAPSVGVPAWGAPPVGSQHLPPSYMYTQSSTAIAPPPAPIFLEEAAVLDAVQHAHSGALAAAASAGERAGILEAAAQAEHDAAFPARALPEGRGAMSVAALKRAMAMHAELASEDAARRRAGEAAAQQLARESVRAGHLLELPAA